MSFDVYYFPTANINRLYPYAVSTALSRETLWEPSFAEFEEPQFFEKIERDAELKRLLTYRRQLIASERWYLEPASDSRADQKAASILTALLKKIPRFQQARFLLASAFYRSNTWSRIYGGMSAINLPGFGVGKWWNVTQLKDVDKREFELQRNREAEAGDPERRRYWRWMLADKSQNNVQFRPVDLDNFIHHIYSDEERGLGHGTSIADALYFLNWFKQEILRNGMEFLGRWSQGMLVYYLDMVARGKKDSGTSTQRQTDALALLKSIQSGNKIALGVTERLENLDVPTGGWSTARDALQYVNEQASRLILGSVTNTGGGTDRGSLARAEVEKDSMQALVQFDRAILDETITSQLVERLLIKNWAMISSMGCAGASCPVFRSTGDAIEDPAANLELFTTIIEKVPQLGAKIPASEVFRRLGVSPAPQDDGVETLLDLLKAPGDPEDKSSAAGSMSQAAEIIEKVRAGTLPANSAVEILAIAFGRETAARMVLPATEARIMEGALGS